MDRGADRDPDAHDPLIGETLANRYQIEVRLGEGAMGSVYRAKHVKVGRPFAVKILHPELLTDKKVAQRFEREAELAGRLRHPNVIGVVDVGETVDGLRYMVMDFAEGMDLAGLLSEAPMQPARIVNLTRQLLEGLFHAHEAGLIHRDFKPENVIIERDAHGHEVPRIVDFGIAILREGGDSQAAHGRLTTNGLVLGTPHYMAPEQAVADPIDHRIDLFALGIVVYEMLCGKLPFDGTGAEVARANLLLDPPPISQRVPYLEVDPLLEAFARRMMAKRREARPPTARAAREILDLIDRDRAAAATALGVPLEQIRKPMVTQDVTPEPPPRPDSAQYDAVAAPDAAPQQGPSMPAMLTAPKSVSKQRSIPTSVTPPLTWDEGRRSPKLIVIAVLAAAAVVIVILVLNRAPKATIVAAADQGSAGSSVAIVTPLPLADGSAGSADRTPTGSATTPTVDDSATGSDTPPTGSDTEIAVGSAAKPVPRKLDPKKLDPKKLDPRKVDPKKVDPKKLETKVEPTPIVEPPKVEVVSAGQLAALFSTVGRELEVLRARRGDDSISELQPRYRLVQLNDAMSTQDKRDTAFAALTKLLRDIRTKAE
ncbi:MAG: protein kinase [Deltaproteobacteria bacterium]|nr:protein kinase [Deltaproteobacteria bacterium]